jgi:hypothetical protein
MILLFKIAYKKLLTELLNSLTFEVSIKKKKQTNK